MFLEKLVGCALSFSLCTKSMVLQEIHQIFERKNQSILVAQFFFFSFISLVASDKKVRAFIVLYIFLYPLRNKRLDKTDPPGNSICFCFPGFDVIVVFRFNFCDGWTYVRTPCMKVMTTYSAVGPKRVLSVPILLICTSSFSPVFQSFLFWISGNNLLPPSSLWLLSGLSVILTHQAPTE